MSLLTVLLILLAGAAMMVGTAAIGWFCWRFLRTLMDIERGLKESVAGLVSATAMLHDVHQATVALKVAAAEVRLGLDRVRVGVEAVAAGVTSAQDAMKSYREELSLLASERETFRRIAGSLVDLDNGIKTFLAVVVNTQVPGAMPADIVKGTSLDATGGRVYQYDEGEMAEQERMRRKARGETEPEAPEERETERG